MEITLLSHPIRSKNNIEQDHYWYDAVQKKMLHGRGGKMIFVYDKEQKRSVPRIVDQEGWTTKPSFPLILKWIEQNKDKFGISVNDIAPGHHINIQIDHHRWDEISSDLYNHKIMSDYNEKELK